MNSKKIHPKAADKLHSSMDRLEDRKKKLAEKRAACKKMPLEEEGKVLTNMDKINKYLKSIGEEPITEAAKKPSQKKLMKPAEKSKEVKIQESTYGSGLLRSLNEGFKKIYGSFDDSDTLSVSKKSKRSLTESYKDMGQDLAEYQKWVDYDMKKYHKISDKTTGELEKAGLSVVKDQYGQYEVIAKKADKDAKKESMEESKQPLTEKRWRYNLKAGKELRAAIDEEDYDGVKKALEKAYKEINKAMPDHFDDEDLESTIDDLEAMDSTEDELDYALNDFYDLCDNLGIWVDMNESLKEDSTKDEYKDMGQDLGEYQKWVDYDMKKYHKISDKTMKEIAKAGLSVVKDQYGQYEVIAKEADRDSKKKN